MSDKWAVDIVAALGGGKKEIAPSGALPGDSALATIVSAVPFSISLRGTVISKKLYINPCLKIEAQPGRLEAVFQNTDPLPAALAAFLKQYHEAAVVRAGDTVVVKQFGTSYFVMEKVEPV